MDSYLRCWNLYNYLSTIGNNAINISQFSSVQSLSRVRLFVTPWTAAPQASLSITSSRSLLKLVSIEPAISSSVIITLSLFFVILFISGCPGSSSLRGLSCSWGEWGLSQCSAFPCWEGQASVAGARGPSSCVSQVLARWLRRSGTWARLLWGMWDLPGSGIKPLSPELNWQVYSLPLSQQGSPVFIFFLKLFPKDHFSGNKL